MTQFWSGQDQCVFFVYEYRSTQDGLFALVKSTYAVGAHPQKDTPLNQVTVMTAAQLGFLVGYCPQEPRHSTLLQHGAYREVVDVMAHLVENGTLEGKRRLARWPGCPTELDLVLLDSSELSLDEINDLVNIGGQTGALVERHQRRVAQATLAAEVEG